MTTVIDTAETARQQLPRTTQLTHAPTGRTTQRFCLRRATLEDRRVIYRLRHAVYARELGQHRPNQEGLLRDALDDFNIYLVAGCGDEIAGFVSVTPPGSGGYSVDKYLRRDEFPELTGPNLYEVRLLTVLDRFRGREVAGLLMYAALRWVEARGGERLVAIGRREVLDLYLRVGLKRLGCEFSSGAVTYELLTATVSESRARLKELALLLDRIKRSVDWQLEMPFRPAPACFHGGAFFTSVGPEFDHLERRHDIISADVLDAWFPPSPKVIAALQTDLPWLLRTSPPTQCEGLLKVIARVRGVPESAVLPGAGSSDLIFRALRHWLQPSSRVLILDPMYGEYAHVLEQVIGCHVDRLPLCHSEQYRVNPSELTRRFQMAYDLVVLVNPNSPTGQHIERAELERLVRTAPAATRVWVDETYVEYAGDDQSLESFAAASANVVVCKSMSKVYALSGTRVAYLCGPERLIAELRGITPPWVVGLPAQVAAVAALQDPAYYADRRRATHQLRSELAARLAGLAGWEVVPGVANFLLCHLPADGPAASTLVRRCREHGLFLREVGAMGKRLGDRAVRVAVKDAPTQKRMLERLRRSWDDIRLKASTVSPDSVDGHFPRPREELPAIA